MAKNCKGCGYKTLRLANPNDPTSWEPECSLDNDDKVKLNKGCSHKEPMDRERRKG